ncbi:MAG: DoxX family protein [Gaiellaceae bacterium]|jgi:putative oxidoreductase
MAYGILLLRIVVGTTMAGHGVQKLLGWFDGPGLKGVEQMFGKLGFRAAAAMAMLAAIAETGGLLFAVGLLTPLAALGIAIVMLNAIGSVHWKNGFWNSAGGFEFPLVMLAAAVAVAATGPGRFSADAAIGWDGSISGLWWGVGVLAAAIVISALTLVTRRVEQPLEEEAALAQADLDAPLSREAAQDRAPARQSR